MYFLSPLWPYVVNTAISLDNHPPFPVDLTDTAHLSQGGIAETVKYQVVWGATGLENTTHTVVASMVPTDGSYVVVDAFTYGVEHSFFLYFL